MHRPVPECRAMAPRGSGVICTRSASTSGLVFSQAVPYLVGTADFECRSAKRHEEVAPEICIHPPAHVTFFSESQCSLTMACKFSQVGISFKSLNVMPWFVTLPPLEASQGLEKLHLGRHLFEQRLFPVESPPICQEQIVPSLPYE